MRTSTKQKTLLTRAAATLLLAMLTTATAWADTGNEADGICYIGADGTPKNTATDGIDGNDTPTVLTTALTIENYNTNLDGWYVVTSDQTFYGLEITGDAHVILSDGVTLRSNRGVFVTSGKSLTIYGQTAGTGHLIATTDMPWHAGIGGQTGSVNCGTVTINGGTVTATGGENGGAGIGGGYSGSGGTIVINGGTVTANGGGSAAGIGGGSGGSGGTIVINGGTVTANGDSGGSGIGGGSGGSGESITINGGTVTATTGGGAAIGGDKAGGNITILGGQVTASGTGLFAVGIGSAMDEGATITLGLSDDSDYIKAAGGFRRNYSGTVTIATGQTLYEGTTSYSGTVADASAIGQKLRRYEYYAVIFDPANGNAPSEQEVAPGGTATEPAAPTRTGYDFGGWYADGDAQWDFASTVTAAMTLTARWILLADITLTAHEAEVEGETNYWTTFYCGDADYSINGSACAYTAEYAYDSGNATLTLHRLGTDIPKGTAVVIAATGSSVSMSTPATALAPISAPNSLHGVDVRTEAELYKMDLFGWLDSYTAKLYVMGSTDSEGFGFHEYTGEYIPARKAFLAIGGDNAAMARSITLTFDDEASGIVDVESKSASRQPGSAAWYTLGGKRLAGKPTKRGVYVNNGHKVVIK